MIWLFLMMTIYRPAQWPASAPAATCTYSADCHADECIVTDNRGGQKCVPKQYAVMVWEARAKDCLTGVKMTPDTVMEAPLVDGVPDMTESRLLHVKATYRAECGRIEIRSR